MNIARDVALNRANQLARGMDLSNHREEMSRQYVANVYVSTFEARVLGRTDHVGGVASETFESRLTQLRPHVDHGIESLAAQLAQHGDVTKLRLPSLTQDDLDSYLFKDKISLN
jgi:hypothetical protein